MEPFERALQLAESAAGGVSPRPPVGAVVTDTDGIVIGEGATEPRPGPHAEAVALDMAGEQARGGILYCTLEPHQYQSSVAACTGKIIASGIRSVVCPTKDPSALVNGKGFAALRSEGIEVVHDVPQHLAKRADKLVEPWGKLTRTGMPFVTSKWGLSLDGCVATRTGDSKWISSNEWFRHTHKVRYASDAIITGIGTVLADNPAMTARDLDTGQRLAGRPRLRVVVDSLGRLPPDANMLKESGDIIHAVAVETDSPPGCESLVIPSNEGSSSRPKVDLTRLLAELGDRGFANIMVDAGPELTGELFRLRLVDKVLASISIRVIIGGIDALRPIGGTGPALLTDAPRLRDVETQRMGDDILVAGYVEYAG